MIGVFGQLETDNFGGLYFNFAASPKQVIYIYIALYIKAYIASVISASASPRPRADYSFLYKAIPLYIYTYIRTIYIYKCNYISVTDVHHTCTHCTACCRMCHTLPPELERLKKGISIRPEDCRSHSGCGNIDTIHTQYILYIYIHNMSFGCRTPAIPPVRVYVACAIDCLLASTLCMLHQLSACKSHHHIIW
jgi:hypothetical protein